jgi:hypothetical protein
VGRRAGDLIVTVSPNPALDVTYRVAALLRKGSIAFEYSSI